MDGDVSFSRSELWQGGIAMQRWSEFKFATPTSTKLRGVFSSSSERLLRKEGEKVD